ncbi:MAG: ribonuclease E/G, partial [Pedosphaera sp.]|nr:ribonuclease E/G [Pedosphaera sp.]
MSDPKFSRRRRGGQRFRPKGGMHQPQPDNRSAATEARTEAVSGQGGDEAVYDKRRHEADIVRAENAAHGISHENPADAEHPVQKSGEGRRDRTYREPKDEEREPVLGKPVEKPRGLIETIKAAAQKVVERVRRLVQPEKQIRKEVIINAESL